MRFLKRKLRKLIIFAGIIASLSAGTEMTLQNIPVFAKEAIIENVIKAEDGFVSEENGNVPYFLTEEDIPENATIPFESYAPLDYLGRCNVAFANVCKEIMPTEKRGEIGMIKPSGWHTYNFGKLVDGNYLYNRCHLIAFCLAGENANECNLITGTRYLNTEGMLPYEEKVLDYVKKTGNHVLYRVTPLFEGEELVARAVRMEAYSVEDNGKGICFNVKVENIQPGVKIDYKTGEAVMLWK